MENTPSSVVIYNNINGGELRSVRLTPADDRQFVFIKNNDKICYAKKCLELRGSYSISRKLDNFSCKHLQFPPSEEIYRIQKFPEVEIEEGIPDDDIKREVELLQKLDYPSVVKVSQKSYAVICQPSSTSTMMYIHVKIVSNNTGLRLYCMGDECKKKIGRTKQE